MDSGGGNPGMGRKRKMDGQDLPIPKRYLPTSHADAGDEENDSMLTLSLSSFHHSYVQQHHPAPRPPPQPCLQFSLPELTHSPSINQETGTSSTSVHPALPSPPPPPPPPPPQVRGPELILSPHHRVYINQETGTSSTSVHPVLPSPPPPPPPPPPQVRGPELILSPYHRVYINQETGTSSTSVHHALPSPPQPPPPPLQVRGPELILSPHHRVYINQETGTSSTSANAAPPSRPRASRRNPSKAPREGKSETIPRAFLWSTTTRATVQSLSYLRSKQINSISNDVQCKKCDRHFTMELNLEEKFKQIRSYIELNKTPMCQRAPTRWMNPDLPGCTSCGNESCIRPLISDKKRSINWLFLLLGEMLGLLTLRQLKYFCKHTDNHRTGAKDRVLYLTYLGLCKQLEPTGPFDL